MDKPKSCFMGILTAMAALGVSSPIPSRGDHPRRKSPTSGRSKAQKAKKHQVKSSRKTNRHHKRK